MFLGYSWQDILAINGGLHILGDCLGLILCALCVLVLIGLKAFEFGLYIARKIHAWKEGL